LEKIGTKSRKKREIRQIKAKFFFGRKKTAGKRDAGDRDGTGHREDSKRKRDIRDPNQRGKTSAPKAQKSLLLQNTILEGTLPLYRERGKGGDKNHKSGNTFSGEKRIGGSTQKVRV